MVHRLPNGRDVDLVELKMVGTYSGFLEGTLTTISQSIRKSLPARAARVLPPAHPLAVIPPPAGDLPIWFCVAELQSQKAVRNPDPDYGSKLYACWFMDDTARSVDAIIESILPHLDWEGVAEDYDMYYI